MKKAKQIAWLFVQVVQVQVKFDQQAQPLTYTKTRRA